LVDLFLAINITFKKGVEESISLLFFKF